MLKSKWATQPDEAENAAAPAADVAPPEPAAVPAQAAHAPVRGLISDPRPLWILLNAYACLV